MSNLGFGGQFGGGFIQGPGPEAPAPSGVVTYEINWGKMRPRDDSQRRSQGGPLVTQEVGPIHFRTTSNWMRRRY